MNRAYVSLGSNIDRERHLRAAVARLGALFGELTLSSVYESEAVGFDGAPFLNLVAGFDTEAEAGGLVEVLRRIEADCGRVREAREMNSRTLDIDLLLLGDQVAHVGGLELPRPDIARYAFVLRPLAEIAGPRPHPVLGRSFAELWSEFDAGAQPTLRVPFSFAPVALSG